MTSWWLPYSPHSHAQPLQLLLLVGVQVPHLLLLRSPLCSSEVLIRKTGGAAGRENRDAKAPLNGLLQLRQHKAVSWVHHCYSSHKAPTTQTSLLRCHPTPRPPSPHSSPPLITLTLHALQHPLLPAALSPRLLVQPPSQPPQSSLRSPSVHQVPSCPPGLAWRDLFACQSQMTSTLEITVNAQHVKCVYGCLCTGTAIGCPCNPVIVSERCTGLV